MVEVKYGGKQGEAFQLALSDDLVAVRTHSGRSFRAGPVSRPEVALVDGLDLVAEFPEAAVDVFRRRPDAKKRSVATIKKELQKVDDTRFAGRVLVDEISGEPVLYTENLFIKFVDDAEADHCREILSEVGLTVKSEAEYSRNAYFVQAPEGVGRQVFDMALTLLDREDVEFCHPELVRKRAFRQVPAAQWHLAQTTVGGQPVNAHVRAEAAHESTKGDGTTIAVIDDGVDLDHEEFSTSGKIAAPRDATNGNANPRPRSGDDHGTACAGVACADGRFEASGVAPKARLMPIRLVSGLGSQAEADAFKWAADNGADVISCSWGPVDGRWSDPDDPRHNTNVPLPDSTRLAIDYAVNTGRGGKGCVILWAAGNGNESVDNDGYARYPKVIAVAACNDRSRRSVYSDFGDAILCAFPSSDFGHTPFDHPEPLTPGIFTTDRSGSAGYNNGDPRAGDAEGDYTNSFGGTSSAAPGAAGVAALVIARNPDLRWDEVRDVLKRSCDRIDPQGGQYNADGHSRFYGYGRLNAETAVRLAVSSASQQSLTVAGSFNVPIRDRDTSQVSLEVCGINSASGCRVEVDVEHTYIGDLIVTLQPPQGTGVQPVVLHNRAGGGTDNLRQTYDAINTPPLAALAGKDPRGTWTLQVEDRALRDQGAIRGFSLRFVEATQRDATRAATAEKTRKTPRKRRRQTATT